MEDNTTTQILLQLTYILISAASAVLAYYARKWLITSDLAKKYQLDTIITEKTIQDAIIYAEDKGTSLAVNGIRKQELSLKYIDEINPELVKEYGDSIKTLIDRKVAERFHIPEKITATPETIIAPNTTTA